VTQQLFQLRNGVFRLSLNHDTSRQTTAIKLTLVLYRTAVSELMLGRSANKLAMNLLACQSNIGQTHFM